MHAIHTACGIETSVAIYSSMPISQLHAIHTACGIETDPSRRAARARRHCMQSIPLAVLKLHIAIFVYGRIRYCMQSIPLAVLKHSSAQKLAALSLTLHAIHTACGIETRAGKDEYCGGSLIACNPYRLRY